MFYYCFGIVLSLTMQKFTLEEVKKIPAKTLLKLINIAKASLKKDKTMQEVFDKHGVDINEIDTIPVFFKDLDVSARTDHGVIWLNYKLLCDGDFSKDYSYLIHEITHTLQQCYHNGPTKGSNDDDYLDNPSEIEGFQNQVKYIDETEGENKANQYVNKVLDHHEVNNKEERQKRKDTLMKLLGK